MVIVVYVNIINQVFVSSINFNTQCICIREDYECSRCCMFRAA